MMEGKTTSDMMGRAVPVNGCPQRIVSLVPSQTELLHYLSLEKEVVGITKFCISPSAWWHTKTKIGGTKTVHLEALAALQPDLILGNKEENSEEDIEWLSARFPTWMSDIYSIDDAMQMMLEIGKITGKQSEAEILSKNITKAFAGYDSEPKGNVAYLIWNDPPMTVNGRTFISDVLRFWGGGNAFAKVTDSRYPSTSAEELRRFNLDYLFLSSEPFPFKEQHKALWQAQLPATKVVLVDGEFFSWYGSKMLGLPMYLRRLDGEIKANDKSFTNRPRGY